MQGGRRDAVRALRATGNAAARPLWKTKSTIIYEWVLSAAQAVGLFLCHFA
jgi:hypothetical protein